MATVAGDGHVAWPQNFNEVPKEIFHRPDIYAREIKEIFQGKEWHPVVHLAEIPRSGDFKTSYLGEIPILAVHGEDGEIRIFENACTHRGTQLQTCNRGSAEKIECPYHRWTFSNSGELLGCPGKSYFPDGFDPRKHGLRQLRSAVAMGLVFATCSKEVPELDAYLGEAKEFIGKVLGREGRLKLLGYQKVLVSSNWKAYADNEGYHAPLLHAAFRLLRWKGGKGFQTLTSQAHKITHVDLNVPESGFLNDRSLVEVRDEKAPPQSVIVSLFPISIIIKHLDVINVRYAFPRSPDETEVHYAYFSEESDSPALAHHRLRQASNLLGPSGFISLEDGAVFNRLHVGARTTGNVAFQKGIGTEFDPNQTSFRHNDEAGNLIRWERYRRCMGF